MKTIKLLFFSLIFLNLSCTSQSKKINGISFVASPEAISEKHTTPIQKVSANFVALMPFGFIKNLASPNISYNTERQWFGETEKGVKQYADEFQKKGIKLMIKPQIWVWKGEFTGNIQMKTEEEWLVLEKSYETFILDYAKQAANLKAEIFCIGTELEKFIVNRPNYWKALILKIKKVYFGKLTYAANWDEFKRVSFWKDLDYIGIDAYFPVSNKKTATVEEFVKGWVFHKKDIIKVQQEVKIPVLFTEYGYRSVDFTGKKPWDSNRVEGNINLNNQSNALRAIHNQFWKEDWFAGGFLWKWFHNHETSGGVNNNRFTPQNKPAQITIKEIYEQ